MIEIVREAVRGIHIRHGHRYPQESPEEAIQAVYCQIAVRVRRKRPDEVTRAYLYSSAWRQAKHYYTHDLKRFHRHRPDEVGWERQRDDALPGSVLDELVRQEDGRRQDDAVGWLAERLRERSAEERHTLLPARFPDPRPAGSRRPSRATRYRHKQRLIARLRTEGGGGVN